MADCGLGEKAAKPVELIGCTVLPGLAGSILRAAADEIDPRKPVLRGSPAIEIKPREAGGTDHA